MTNAKIRKAHKKAFFWNGNRSTWMQHKATCPDCGGFAVSVRIEPSPDETRAPMYGSRDEDGM